MREVFVADTDAEARKLSSGDMMGRMQEVMPRLKHLDAGLVRAA